MRVVFDTNVVISGLLWKGTTKTLFDFVDRGSVTLCLTPLAVEEVERVLRYPKIFKQLRTHGVAPEEVVAYLVKHSLLFPDVHVVRVVAEDPSDDVFLNCAFVSGATWIVSGDQHLLRIGVYRGTRIVTPRQFLKLF